MKSPGRRTRTHNPSRRPAESPSINGYWRLNLLLLSTIGPSTCVHSIIDRWNRYRGPRRTQLLRPSSVGGYSRLRNACWMPLAWWTIIISTCLIGVVRIRLLLALIGLCMCGMLITGRCQNWLKRRTIHRSRRWNGVEMGIILPSAWTMEMCKSGIVNRESSYAVCQVMKPVSRSSHGKNTFYLPAVEIPASSTTTFANANIKSLNYTDIPAKSVVLNGDPTGLNWLLEEMITSLISGMSAPPSPNSPNPIIVPPSRPWHGVPGNRTS